MSFLKKHLKYAFAEALFSAVIVTLLAEPIVYYISGDASETAYQIEWQKLLFIVPLLTLLFTYAIQHQTKSLLKSEGMIDASIDMMRSAQSFALDAKIEPSRLKQLFENMKSLSYWKIKFLDDNTICASSKFRFFQYRGKPVYISFEKIGDGGYHYVLTTRPDTINIRYWPRCIHNLKYFKGVIEAADNY